VAEIPRAVLSEHFQACMQGRRLRAAVFLTYEFDPGFFEQEILPVFFDIPLSHASNLRLVQLEDALRQLPGQIAVYYDANGLTVSDAGSAKLDVRRIPVQHRAGVFHPKNLFLLVEEETPNTDGVDPPKQTLLVASLSANLTRSGWWENVEVCHVEAIAEGDRTRLRDDLIGFLESLRRKTAADNEQGPLREIVRFLRRTDQRTQRSTAGQLLTHFYDGRASLPDFLEQMAGGFLKGANLEVISPYFDDAPVCKPLEALIERFEPQEIRVYLPRNAAGEAQCREDLYEAVAERPGVAWGRLPTDLLRRGADEAAGERFVHAKVYRFFTQRPKQEFLFIGSANLMSAAHQARGNVETGFLVQTKPPPRPEFWLTPEEKPPTAFEAPQGVADAATAGGCPLNLRYHWDQSLAEAFWDAPGESPVLRLEARGIALGEVLPLPSRTWTSIPPDLTARIGNSLAETSLFKVYGATAEPALVLVQEEGMSHKPSLLLQLSIADILRFWSLLTPAQRSAFLEARAPAALLIGQGADLVTQAKIVLEEQTIFDRFAGAFHAFGCLERAVRAALDGGNEKEADYRLFGRKYDSLGSLLERVLTDQGTTDEVDRYVIGLCARQLRQELAEDYPDYWADHPTDVGVLDRSLGQLDGIRGALIAQNGAEFALFLDWFDHWFLKRAAVAQEGTA
jgi:hypothetical protein